MSSRFDLYKKRNSISSDKSFQTASFIRQFKNSPNMEKVYINNNPALYSVVILDNVFNKNVLNKQLISNITDGIKIGDLVDWENNKWMCINKNSRKDIYDIFIMDKINFIVKCKDDEGLIMDLFAVITDRTSGNGEKEGKYMTLQNGLIDMVIKADQHTTTELKNGKKYLIKGKGYEITHINNIESDELLFITLKQVEINNAKDNVDIGIANYYVNNEYQVVIKEGNVSIAPIKTVQLSTIIYQNGVSVLKDIEWISMDTKIATVSSTGLVTSKINGNVKIRAMLKENHDIYNEVNINVRNIPIQDATYNISGNTILQWTEQGVYTPQTIINGVATSNAYIFTIDYQGIPEGIISILETTSTYIKIKANAPHKGKIKLIAKLNNGVSVEKIIEIKAFF